MNETVLIGKSEKFLDEISRKKIDLTNISDLEQFLKIYQSLKENLEELHDLKDNMESKGYKAPYRSLARYGSTIPGEIMVEELHDVNRHNQHFRMKAAAKKNVLDRAKSSIASHKIALGNLEEYGLIKCTLCGKSYRINEFYDLNNLSCACQSTDFELEIYESGLSRVSIISYLPLSGNYMVLMTDLTLWGRESFKQIMKLLKQERKGVVKTVSLVIKVMESGRWIRKRVTLDADDKPDYEEELRKKYGSNVRIEFLQFQRKKPTIINDRHTRTALSLAYTRFCEEFLKKFNREILIGRLNNLEKLELYDELFLKAESFEPVFWEENVTKSEVRQKKLHKMLLEHEIMDNDEKIDSDISDDINSRHDIEKNLFPKVPLTLISWDLIKYYLMTSHDRRTNYSGPFPYLRHNLDRNQIKVFGDFDQEAVEILKNYLQEKVEYIPHIQKVITKKFEIEQKMKGLNMKTNYSAFGAAIVNLESEMDINLCSDIFSVSVKDIETEKVNIQTMGKPSTKKAKKFMEMIKK
jgi:hypothetical protein